MLVTLGTDGTTNWVRTPDGRKHNLGQVSALEIMSRVGDVRRTGLRSLLDRFNAGEEVMLVVDADGLGALLAPRRTKFAESLIETQYRGAVTMGLTRDLGLLENHVGLLSRAAKENVVSSKMAEGVDLLIRMASALKSEPAYFDLVASDEKQSRFKEGEPADPTENMSPADAKKWDEMNEEHKDNFKSASEEDRIDRLVMSMEGDLEAFKSAWKKYQSGPKYAPQLENAKRDLVAITTAVKAALRILDGIKTASTEEDTEETPTEKQAAVALDLIEKTRDRIASLVASGKRFNSRKALEDLRGVAEDIAQLSENPDAALVAEQMPKVAARAEHLHGLFVSKE